MKIVSLFSGCGGSSLGYQLAGGKVLCAVEYNKNAVQTYRKNFPETLVLETDIAQVNLNDLMTKLNLKPEELDILDGSPPCQGFSTQGKRQSNDPRNNLFLEYCRFLKAFMPKVFVMENVSGLVKGKMKFIFVKILTELKSYGYRVKAKLLNTKYFNVPQSRPRLIFIGIREDLDIEPSFPKENPRIITVKEAFQEVPDGERITPTKGFLQHIISQVKPGERISDYHPKGHYFSSFRLAYDKPAPTICSLFSHNRSMVFHPYYNSSISISELKRLFTFPDNFEFIGTFKNQWARLGNCVPPQLMKSIGSHIRENILKILLNDK